MLQYWSLALLLIAWPAKAATVYDALIDTGTMDVAAVGRTIDGFLQRPNGELLVDPKAAEYMKQYGPAIELFRQKAALPNDGAMFAPKLETYDPKVPGPKYAGVYILFRLVLLDLKLSAARGNVEQVQADVVADAQFLNQLSEQKSWLFITAIVQQACFRKAFPILEEVARGGTLDATQLRQILSLFDELATAQDFMEGAIDENVKWTHAMIRADVNAQTAAEARKNLSFWSRHAAKKMQDAEYFSFIYKEVDEFTSREAEELRSAFRRNDPNAYAQFQKNNQAELAGRARERRMQNEWSGLMEEIDGEGAVKAKLAEAAADSIIAVPARPYEKLITGYHVFWNSLNVLRTGLALTIFERAQKRSATKLAELTPNYMTSIPLDSFNPVAPLFYRRNQARFVVYSVGPKRKDDGGSGVFDWEAFAFDDSRSAGNILFRNY